jgi:hypothetical protein
MNDLTQIIANDLHAFLNTQCPGLSEDASLISERDCVRLGWKPEHPSHFYLTQDFFESVQDVGIVKTMDLHRPGILPWIVKTLREDVAIHPKDLLFVCFEPVNMYSRTAAISETIVGTVPSIRVQMYHNGVEWIYSVDICWGFKQIENPNPDDSGLRTIEDGTYVG